MSIPAEISAYIDERLTPAIQEYAREFLLSHYADNLKSMSVNAVLNGFWEKWMSKYSGNQPIQYDDMKRFKDVLDSLFKVAYNPPTIGTNGNWFFDDVDTGVRAEGKDAPIPYVGKNGNWWVGAVDTEVRAKGEKGNRGDKGDTGASGGVTTPLSGLFGLHVDNDGNLWATMPDDAQQPPPVELDEDGNFYYIIS